MAARINNEEAIANNGANVSLQEFNYHAQSICKIEQLPAFGGPINVGTGFLFRVPPYGESKAGHCGIMTCTHVMPNIYKIKDLNENKYQFTFKGIKPKFAMIAQPQYFARIHRTPDDSDKSRRLDITFLEFDIEAIRLNEPIIGRIYYLPPVTYEGDYRATKENVYNTDSDLFSVHYAGGYEMHPAAGRLEMDGWQYQLLTHSLNTDKGSSGAPLIDVSTKRVIAVHRGDVRSKESQNNWHYYPNGATNILPIVDFIRGGTKRDDYIVCNSAVEAESTDDTDGRSVENGRSDAASASARQPAGRLTGVL